MKGKNGVKFFLVVAVIAILTYIAIYGLVVPGTDYKIPSAKDARTGIDIRGGVRAVLGAANGYNPSDKDMDTVKAIIEKRLDNKNIYDRSVNLDKLNDRVIVEIPWKQGETDFNPQKSIDEIGKTALLTFQEVDEDKKDANGVYLPTNKILVEGKDVKDAYPQTNPESGAMEVALEFSAQGAVKFEEATGRLVGKPIAIFMDDQLISAPVVQAKISGGRASITLGTNLSSNALKQTAAEAKNLADTIRSGALPFKLEAKDVNSISPLLGENALNVSVMAGGVSLILVWIFMLLYYRLPGILANVALLGHTVIQLLFISWLGISLTLPGIAGIILTIGMGVDANIIIFERIKEELKNGKTLKAAIDVGFKRAFTAVLDANMITLISSAMLYIFGTGPIKSFAITLGLGVALSFLTAVTASRIMLKAVSDVNIAKHHWLYGV